MEIRAADHGGYVSLVSIERSPDQHPGVKFAVEAKVGEFSGEAAVWASLDAVRAFVAQLQVLEKSRKGKAQLLSMSPNELELSLETYDMTGHLLLRVGLQKRRVVGTGSEVAGVFGAFEVDSGDLLSIVAAASLLQNP